MRARGLKLIFSVMGQTSNSVAPHAGAWIETRLICRRNPLAMSRPMRARGLKQLFIAF